jgi:hypothetical protein
MDIKILPAPLYLGCTMVGEFVHRTLSAVGNCSVLHCVNCVIYVYCYMTKVGILCIFGLHMHLPETGVIEIRTLPSHKAPVFQPPEVLQKAINTL